MKLLAPLYLIFSAVANSQTPTTGPATAKGSCNVVVSGSGNQINIATCCLSPGQVEEWRHSLKQILEKQLDARTVLGMLNGIQSGVNQILEKLGTDPAKLLAKYPLGYTIFELEYSNAVTPYASNGLEEYVFDWSVVRVTKNTPNQIELRLPDVSRRDGRGVLSNAVTTLDKRVGGYGGGYTFADAKTRIGALVVGEVLAVKENGIVFLVGMRRFVAPMPK